jgi:hypothetical protein
LSALQVHATKVYVYVAQVFVQNAVSKSHNAYGEAIFSFIVKLQLNVISVVSVKLFTVITKFLSKVKFQSVTLIHILYVFFVSKSNTALLDRLVQAIIKLQSSAHGIAQVIE